jgi:hypothetical protein
MVSWNCIKLPIGSQPGESKNTRGTRGLLSLKLGETLHEIGDKKAIGAGSKRFR